MSTPAGDFRTRSTVAYSSAVLAASRLQSPHRGGSGSDGEDDNKDLAPFRTAQAPSAPNILRVCQPVESVCVSVYVSGCSGTSERPPLIRRLRWG